MKSDLAAATMTMTEEDIPLPQRKERQQVEKKSFRKKGGILIP